VVTVVVVNPIDLAVRASAVAEGLSPKLFGGCILIVTGYFVTIKIPFIIPIFFIQVTGVLIVLILTYYRLILTL